MLNFGEGYVPVRRGIMEHVADGRMSTKEHHAFLTLLLLADDRTGRWQGSAVALREILRYKSKNRMQEAFLGLEEKGYILRDFDLTGIGNYPILVDKFRITRGPNAGQQVDLAATKQRWGIPEGTIAAEMRERLREAIASACANPVYSGDTRVGLDSGLGMGPSTGLDMGHLTRINNIEVMSDEGEDTAHSQAMDVEYLGEPAEDILPAPEDEPAPSSQVYPEQHSTPRAGEPGRVAREGSQPGGFAGIPVNPNPSDKKSQQLAAHLFHYTGARAGHNTLAHWAADATRLNPLVKKHGGEHVEAILHWVFNSENDFWAKQITSRSEPAAYFVEKFESQLVGRYLGENRKPVEGTRPQQPKEGNTHASGSTRPARSQSRTANNRANAEQAKRELHAEIDALYAAGGGFSADDFAEEES